MQVFSEYAARFEPREDDDPNPNPMNRNIGSVTHTSTPHVALTYITYKTYSLIK